MNVTLSRSRETKSHFLPKMPDLEHGFFNSSNVALPPEKVFEICRNERTVQRVLSDLPKGIKNFLELSFVSAEQLSSDEYEIKWKNKEDARIQGSLSLLLTRATANRGTIMVAEAVFEKFNAGDEKPSDLMNVFLKRMKSLIETGEIPTTTGQPSGRELLISSQEQKYH